MAPSGVQKERLQPEDMYLLDGHELDEVKVLRAPADAVQVTAFFPFGLVKDLPGDAFGGVAQVFGHQADSCIRRSHNSIMRRPTITSGTIGRLHSREVSPGHLRVASRPSEASSMPIGA